MLCPYCERDDDKVIDSRASDAGKSIRRRRECQKCSRRFTTFERVEKTSRLMVIKRDGTRTPFDPEKVLKGLQAACGKRPISEEQKIALVREVEEELMQQYEREVPSKEVGLRVASRLKNVDQIVYIRYASEYFNFQDLEALSREVSELQEEPPIIPTQSDLFNKQ
ncbi:MAG TPA: transcriptional repressor NrdR [Phycisphaerales bacterium]|jgi:transcriptional repressor NrdR|nr:transcriptional repressor NrdR [Phycisphaerales bacterium]HIB01730.1 transcriptional repressor NrdR [Phycisphaerales bacterium]HIB50994.1 transcriptional repressor NrdR [Phycisphaerales bacterium]HIN84093.1 transcriptional repressor NrdR [Phycisphaerales bacterium]HIO52794.1 transcriptional repressor NrdR [Phycisphaerales bacterium]